MHDHVVFFGKDDPRLVPERWRNALDGVEETVTTGGDMSAVLNVVGGPIVRFIFILRPERVCRTRECYRADLPPSTR